MLNTAYGDDDGGIGRDQDGGVDYPVLLGAHQLFTVQDEDHFMGPVHHPQFRHGAAAVLLNHLYDIPGQGLIQEQILQIQRVVGEEWIKGQ
ncbi:MAG: hypothetical protein JRH00_17720, partial [Deltaproteobacteria bacterium]|nr:hypothetical protein [Deltaproteobacteria bacterium]